MIYKSYALRRAEERLAQKIREKEEEEKRKRNSVVYAPAENNSALKQAEMRMAEQINALETEKQRQRSAVYQPQEKSFDALRREAEQKTAQERLQKRQQKRQAASLDAPYWTVQDALDTVQQRREAEGTQEKKTFRDILRNGLLNTSAQQEEVQKRTAKTADALAKTFVAGQTAKTMWDSGQASWWQWPARMVRNAREWAENSEPDSKIMQSTRDFAVEKVFEPFQESKIGQKLEAFVDEGYAKNEKADALVSLLDDGTLGGDAKVFLARLAEAAPALTNEVLLAMGTMGGSVLTTAARLAPKAGRILNAAHTVWTSAKSPVTAIRALRYLNEEYENALANGADEGEALKSALLYALPSALIESSGGIDAVAREVASGQLRSGAGRFLRDLLTRTAVQEGGEEAAQTVLQNLAQGAAYDRERQLFSLTDESAVINPRSIAQSFLYGYAGGVLLGGVTGGADLALRRVRSGEARAALKSEVTRQAEAAGVQLTQAETEAMTDAVTAELMRELGETSNIETGNEAQLRAVRDMAERQRAQQQTTDNAGYTVDATGNIVRDRMQLPEDTGSTTQALLQAQAELDRFNRWRAENFGGAFGRVSDSDYTALKELYLEETGIDIDAAVEEAFSVLYPENVAWRRDPNAPQPGANVTAAALARMEGAAGNRGLQVRATGAPVSEETAAVLDRLDAGQAVSQDIISALPEVQAARAAVAGRQETYRLPGREQLRRQVAEQLEQLGSYTGVAHGNDNGYNGIVAQGRRIDIIIGVPAAGKSSVFVNPLSQAYHSRVIDSDMAKERLPEFNGGLGAGLVHEESSEIADGLIRASIRRGDNIVLPIVGGKLDKLVARIKEFKNAGYSVYLHLNELPAEKATARVLKRYLKEGRFVDPNLVAGYGDAPTRNYLAIREMEGLIDGFTYANNDVPYGSAPRIIESSGTRAWPAREGSLRELRGSYRPRVEMRSAGSENRKITETAGRTGTAGAGGGAGAGNVAAAAGEAGGAAAGAERIGRAGASDAGVFRPVNRRDSRPPRAVGDSEPAPHRTVAETLPGAAGADQRTAGKRFAAGVSSGGRGSEIGRQHPGQDCAETGGRQKWLWSAGDERSGAFRDPDEQFRGCGADACSAATKIPRNTRGSISGQAKGKQRLQGYPS